MALTREQINEAKNFPTEKIREKAKGIKDTLNAIEASQMERDSKKSGMPAGLSKEVATKVIGPIDSLKKKLKETIEDKKPTDDLRSNLSSKRALEQMEKEAAKIKQASIPLVKKVASELSKLEPKALKAASVQRKAREKYDSSKKKEKSERDFMANKYVSDSFDFKQRTKQYLGLNEMAEKDLSVSIEKLAKMSGTGLKKEAVKYVEKKRKQEGITDRKIKQGLGSTFTQAKKKEIITPEKVKEFQDAVREYIKNNPQKEEEKVEESTRYRRNFR